MTACAKTLMTCGGAFTGGMGKDKATCMRALSTYKECIGKCVPDAAGGAAISEKMCDAMSGGGVPGGGVIPGGTSVLACGQGYVHVCVLLL